MFHDTNRTDANLQIADANELPLAELDTIVGGQGSVATTVVDGVFQVARAAARLIGAVVAAL